MSAGSALAIITGARATTTAARCGAPDAIITITTITTGIVVNESNAPLCYECGAKDWSCGGSSFAEGPPFLMFQIGQPTQ